MLMVCTALLGCGQQDVEQGEALRPSEPARETPNFLIYIADDLGYQDVGYTGNPVARTPNIDRLADSGMRFDNAFVPASMCSPSRAALYTGLYPHRNGMSRNHAQANNGVKSMPHYLTALGYRTVLVGKSHVKPFSTFPFERLERRVDDVAKYLDLLGGDPFLMVIAAHHPHVPWLPNRDFNPEAISLPERLLDTPETRQAYARYYSSVAAGDAELGDFLALLDDKGLSRNTVIVFLSDHGPQFPFAKFSNYDAGLRVPFIVYWPGQIEGGSSREALISSTDILPTVIELAGGTPPAGLDGRSLVPLIRGQASSVHDTVYATHSTLGLNIQGIEPYGIRAVRSEKFRYIRNLHPENLPRSFISEPRPLRGSIRYLLSYGVWVPPGVPAYWSSWLERAEHDALAAERIGSYLYRPAEELYDLERDPHELVNLAGVDTYGLVVKELNQQLVCWMREQGDPEIDLVPDTANLTCH
jgi:uncharacterized sulfatase